MNEEDVLDRKECNGYKLKDYATIVAANAYNGVPELQGASAQIENRTRRTEHRTERREQNEENREDQRGEVGAKQDRT